MKPSTPESSSNIRGKFLDETLGTSILSLDGRMHMVNKSGPTASSLWFKNYDGSEANVILPSGFSGSFLFPYAMGIGGVCGSNFVGTYFIENSSLISPTIISLLGMTLSINTNANKQYFINSSGYLDKTNNTQLTKTHNYNSTTGNWDVRGIQFEPRSCNVLNTDTPVFGATGATLGIATDFAAGYWNSTTIPNGMTVWKLVEQGNALPENTCWFSNQSITLLGRTLPTQSVGASPDGISFSSFMVSGFFTGPNKSVSGITKDIIQIWLATSPSGLVKKSVYFDLNTCSVASVSAGGITNAYFSTERYANGWCRCFAGVIYTGATYPADAAYGFSTARRDGSGGYTYGKLNAGDTGHYYVSGLQINYDGIQSYRGVTVGGASRRLYALRVAPTSYLPAQANTDVSGLRFRVPVNSPYFYPEGQTQSPIFSWFHDMNIRSPAGISEDVASFGNSFTWFQESEISGVIRAYYSTVFSPGVMGSNPPIYSFYLQARGSTLSPPQLIYSPDMPTRSYFPKPPGGAPFGFSANADSKIVWSGFGVPGPDGISGIDPIGITFAHYGVNGITLVTGNSSQIGPILPVIFIKRAAVPYYEFVATHGFPDKIFYMKNWAWWPRKLSEEETKVLTSHETQGVLRRTTFSGSDGGYNEASGNYSLANNENTTVNNTSRVLPLSNYVPPPILVP